MKFKDNIILDYIKPYLSDNEYQNILQQRNKYYKVVFKENQHPSGDYSMECINLIEVFTLLRSNLIINILRNSNIFDVVEVWEVDSKVEPGCVESFAKLLFKFNVREIY
jgi:hypothetical protein